MTGSAIGKRREAYSETEIDDETVLMQVDTGEFFSLRGTGRTIWHLIDEAPTRGALLDALATRFDAPRETLADDLDDFLRMLTDAGFLSAR